MAEYGSAAEAQAAAEQAGRDAQAAAEQAGRDAQAAAEGRTEAPHAADGTDNDSDWGSGGWGFDSSGDMGDAD